MATTGFWPVKGSLKDIIKYVENPDKTTTQKFLDDDLFKTLRYVENDEKTDKAMYVSAINCPNKRAYEHMVATKKRYGKINGVVAYHGFQSFKEGEVTADEAHKIGLETAKRMWGAEYEIVVTTHLNTGKLHNHMVVNSVSFKTGRKFENHVSDHYKLRELSDKVCLEHGKSVLKDASFYSKNKGEYWVHKNGSLTHRDILKRDIETALKYAWDGTNFEIRLMALGYEIVRSGEKYQHVSVKAKDWQKSIRLDSLGYTKEVIRTRLSDHMNTVGFLKLYNSNPIYKPKTYPLLELEKQLEYTVDHSHSGVEVLISAIFYLIVVLLDIAMSEQVQEQRNMPLSPSIRMEIAKYDQIKKEYMLLADNKINSVQELYSFWGNISGQIKALESERQLYRNQLRHPKSPEVEQRLKQQCMDLSVKIKPLRDKLRTANKIMERYPKLQKLLETERQVEIAAYKKLQKDRGLVR